MPDNGAADTGAGDAGVPDTGTPDAGFADSGLEDAAHDRVEDAGPEDAGFEDAGFDDASAADAEIVEDAGPDDAGPDDAGLDDAGLDAGDEDAGPPDAGVDGGLPDAGPPFCTVAPNSCPGAEVCLGEACSCIATMHGSHYLRTDGTVVYWNGGTPTIITVSGGAQLTGVTEIYSGSAHGCAMKSDGTVWCWPTSFLGNNSGQLGNGSVSANVPFQDYYIATEVLVAAATPLTGAMHLSGGSSRGYLASNTCAVTSSGSLLCWGSTDSSGGGGGTLFNDGVPGSRAYAVEILEAMNTPLTGVQAVSLGGRHACVIRSGTTAGEVWCWGANIGGPLGQGDQVGRQYPVQVALPGPADQIGAGADATCARIGTSVYCWGSNNSGQVGIGDHTLPANHDGCINYCKLTPAQVVDDTGTPLDAVVDYGMGYLSSCALRSDNTLWCWGISTASSANDWAAPAVINGTALDNVAQFTTVGSNGYRAALRYLNRDASLFRAQTQVSPLCP